MFVLVWEIPACIYAFVYVCVCVYIEGYRLCIGRGAGEVAKTRMRNRLKVIECAKLCKKK